MRVCQFRHDGKWTYKAAATIRVADQEDLLSYVYRHAATCQTAPHDSR